MGWKRIARALAILLLSASFPAVSLGQAPRPTARPLRYRSSDVLVQFHEGVDGATASSVVNATGATRAKRFTLRGRRSLRRSRIDRWWLVELPSGRDPREAMERLSRNPAVQRVQLNYELSIVDFPSDPSLPQLWGLDNTGQTGGTADADIDAPEAWDLAVGDPSVLVAVIDTGVDYTHPDLAANIWTNFWEIAGNGIDDDGNGYVDDVHGYDFYAFDGDPRDEHGHGTHVAGTIAAVGNNGIGVAGVAWSARILPVRFLGPDGSGWTSGAIDAILYASARGAKILNNSWGGGGFSPALEDAIEAANEAGALFVAAAGNNGGDNDISPHYPSSYEVANVVAVAATDHHDVKAAFSNFGRTSVDLAAPGVAIFSTVPTTGGPCCSDPSGYKNLSGTSMAAPHVSGAAAVLLSRFPGVGVEALEDRLLFNTDPLPSLSGNTVTGGRLNLFRALEDDDVPPDPALDLAVAAKSYASVTLIWIATGDDGFLGNSSGYDLRFSTAPMDTSSFEAATRVAGPSAPVSPGFAETVEVRGLSPSTTYYFALRVVDNVGNKSPLGSVVVATTDAASTLFSDDFESGVGAWSITGTDGLDGPALWGLSTHRYRSPTASLYYGRPGQLNYDTGARNSGEITSPPIDLSNFHQASLSFHHFLRTEGLPQFYDQASVRVSSDGGTTWANLCAFTDTSGEALVPASCDLSPFDGGTIRLQFRFDTVDAGLNGFEGWVIDDVSVIASPTGDLPVANPGGPYAAFKNEPIFFDGTASYHPGGYPLYYSWDFGDGTTDTGPAPWHFYWAAGTYTVTLVVTDGIVSSLPATTTAVVTNRAPIANPGGPYSGIESVPLAFNGTLSYDPDGDSLSFLWDFGDGTTGSEPSLFHTYGAPGTYAVTLTVSDGTAVSSPATTSAQILVRETVPPAAVTDLAVGLTRAHFVSLSWTATGDDGHVGTATSYDLRYATAPLDEASFASATSVTALSAPKPPGSAETTVVRGLVPETDYYFALKVRDEVGNASGLSNLASARTPEVAEIFRDDMESGSQSWSVSGSDGKGGPALWHLSPHRTRSPQNAFYYGIESQLNYNSGARNYGFLQLAPIDLLGYRGGWLSFFHFFQTESSPSYDVLRVESSTDGGLTWSQIYRRSSNNSGGMVEQGLDLSVFDGKTVRLRFSFDSVDSSFNGYEGWVVDDVVVTVDRLLGMPEARPGGPYSVFRNSDVVLDGTASTDPDGEPLAYQWDFGDGTTGTGATAIHRYASPGAYRVTLVVSDAALRSAPASTVVTVSNRPPVAHPGGPYSGYAEALVTFDGSGSIDLDEDPLTYQWSFGDGATGSGIAPSHAYIAPGTYRVSLVVHDGIDASSAAETNAVIAPEAIAPSPVVDLEVVDAGPRSVGLAWTSTGDDGGLGTAAAYDLRYGTTPIDEQSFVTATPVASPNLPKLAGNPESLEVFGLSPETTYYFALKVIDDVGNASALSNVAAITTPSEMFLFADDFESGTIRWSLGGSDGKGGPSLWHIASHRYASPSSAFYYGRDDTRTYQTGARNFGSLSSIEIDLRGHEHARLSFQHFFETQAATNADLLRVLVSADGGVQWTTVFQRSSAASSGVIGESADLSAFDGQVVQIRFDFDTVDDLENDHEGWFVDDVLLAVESRPGVPTANPGGPYSGFRGLALSFDGSGSSDPDGDGLTYRWSFGDGTTGVGPAPAHAYISVGTYNVSLVVHDAAASSPPATTTVTIGNRPPVASPGGPYTGFTNVSLGFDGSDSSDPEGDALTYSWTFGDGASADGPTPAHVYSNPGAYEVTLVVSDGLVSSPPATTTVSIVAPQLTLTSPNTPVSWPVGSTQTIAWTSNLAPATTVGIEMSPDGGDTWIAIASAAPNSGIYDWKVKPPHTASARVRVSWTVFASVADVSDSNFTIGSPGYRVKKINPLASTSPTSLVNARGSLFFLANDGTAHGTELWRSDGTEAGTVLVKDITAGSGSTDINLLTPVGRYVYFVTGNASRLWRSDGTAAGTVVVHDIVYFGYAFPLGSLTAVGETLFYTLCQTSDGCELWRASASGGVARVKDIVPGSGSSSPMQLAAVSDKLFFSAYHPDTGRELWKSDGTEAGTVLVKDIGPGSCCSGNPTQLTDVGGTLFYSGATDGSSLYPDRELWKSDGTASGTVRVKNDAYSYLSLFITETEAAGDLLFYSAYPENSCCTYDRELYRSDGTTLGTGRVRDIWIGESGSNPQYLTAVGGTVFFTASELGNPNQLFMSDGTAAGTKRLNQVTPDVASSPSNLARVGDSLFFQGNRAPFGVELWQTDGTAEGTALAQDVLAGTPSSYPGSLMVSGHRLFFVASDLSNHRELWVLNLPVNEAPVAHAGGPYAGFRHQPVPFSASRSFDPDGDGLTYSWTFGDGSSGSGIAPTHAYAEPGTYVVTLVVSDGTAASAPATASITIQNRPPVARAGGPYTGVRNQAIGFDGTSSTDADGDALTYQWDFGDGTTGTGATPAHAYATLGTFTVTLVVNDGVSSSAPATTTVTIQNQTPVAKAGGPYAGIRNQAVSFDGTSSSDPDGDALTYQWDFGDGATGTDALPAHPYLALGNFTVTLVVNDGVESSGPATATVTIENLLPSVSLTSPSNGSLFTAPADVALVADASDPDGSVALVEFFAGPAKIGEDADTPYEMPWTSVGPGIYSLTARVTDETGASTTSGALTVRVNAPPSVTLTSPAPGSLFTAPASLTLTASASDPDGSIVQVEFFHGSTGLGVDTTSPYSVVWQGVPAGSYSLSARATDDLGANLTSSAVPVAVEARLSPAADAFVRDGSSNVNRNFGTSTALEVRRASGTGSRWTYLKFDTSGVPSVGSARLRLYGNLSATTGTVVRTAAFPVSDTSWSESLITWNNKPAPGASALSTVTLVNGTTVARWYEWDLTAYLQAEKAAGRQRITLVLKSEGTSSPFATFRSREAGGNRPELVISP